MLGIAYTADLKVHVLSPAIALAKLLRENGVGVNVRDSYYSDDEIRDITGCEPFSFPEGLGEFDAVLLVAGHSKCSFVNSQSILQNLNAKVVLDNAGVWKDISFPDHVEYHEAGDAGRLEPLDKVEQNGGLAVQEAVGGQNEIL